ncbi:MAG: hypothetical protein M3198_03025 [Actinomycetota bacterium]|nr:hypothetical protein [Actinomycetota bacterium]
MIEWIMPITVGLVIGLILWIGIPPPPTRHSRTENEIRLPREILAESQSTLLLDQVGGLTQLALARRQQGAPEEALDIAKSAVEGAGRQLLAAAAEAKREAGMCAAALNDESSAIKYWGSALRTFANLGNHEEAAKTARLIGDHLSKGGDAEGAAAAYREGLAAVTRLP